MHARKKFHVEHDVEWKGESRVKRQIIDAHIHLDMYEQDERMQLMDELEQDGIDAVVAVSNDFTSSVKQLKYAAKDSRIQPAVGYHPEQSLPTEGELSSILRLIDENAHRITAIGEVGLPYYVRQTRPELNVTPYIELLECFIRKAAELDLPIALHAVYEDAHIVCGLLEKYAIRKAHFHWFKGDEEIIRKIVSNGYMISVTPEVVYREKIRHIVRLVPLSQLMVETDGPWPFEHSFKGKLTHPSMLHESIRSIAEIKGISVDAAYEEIYKTTREFYCI